MKVVGLISGGKDSCFNLMLCSAAGHSVVALAHIKPYTGDEQDSMMYQSVGHEGVALYADAMGLSLYVGTTLGQTSQTGLTYESKPGDEVEDLMELLRRVKEGNADIGGVAVGAVLSNYQRVRVENVCQRLGLVCLAYLWQRDQLSLIQDMVSANVEAVLIKIASIGLEVGHLGKTIEQMIPTLKQLNDKYGVSVCGEGGEYETFTLDCPLFTKKIVIEESEVVIHSDDAYAPVAYLKLKKLFLQEKSVIGSDMPLVCSPSSLIVKDGSCTSNDISQTAPLSQAITGDKWAWLIMDGNSAYSSIDEQCSQLLQSITAGPNFVFLYSGREALKMVWTLGTQIMVRYGVKKLKAIPSWEQVPIVYLYLKSMGDYVTVNGLYSSLISTKPPARVCIGTKCLPTGVLLRVELMVTMATTSNTSNMHVQSLSYWAPPNIGPYSQAYTVDNVLFLAGVIGLLPHLNKLAESVEDQISLSLGHCQALLTTNNSSWEQCMYGVCYCVTMDTVMRAKGTWNKYIHAKGIKLGFPIVYMLVSELPRGAEVEWHFVAVTNHLMSTVTNFSHCFIDDSVLVHAYDVIAQCSLQSIDETYPKTCLSLCCCTLFITPLPCMVEEATLLTTALKVAISHLDNPTDSGHHHSFPLLKIYLPILSSDLDFTSAVKEHYDGPFTVVPYMGMFGVHCPLVVQLISLL